MRNESRQGSMDIPQSYQVSAETKALQNRLRRDREKVWRAKQHLFSVQTDDGKWRMATPVNVQVGRKPARWNVR